MPNQTASESPLPPGQERPVEITLDGNAATSPWRRRNGKEIRELGDPNRVNGFETQRINCKSGKKEATIPDGETVELHPHECFRTVPNAGGPGAPE
jgi:hypothetical protein